MRKSIDLSLRTRTDSTRSTPSSSPGMGTGAPKPSPAPATSRDKRFKLAMRIAPTNAGVALVRGESLKTLASLSPYRKDKLLVGAVQQEDLVAIDMLLDAGADPNGRVKVGLGRKTTTPVHAVHAGPLQNEVRELLYENPHDPAKRGDPLLKIKTHLGDDTTPLDLAIDSDLAPTAEGGLPRPLIDYHLIGSADQQLVQERVDRRKADLEKREQKQDRILESHKRGGDVPVFSPSGYAAFKREDAAIASAQMKLEDIASKTWKSQRGELHSVNHHQARVNVNLVLEGAARPAPFDAEGGIGADSQDAHRQMMFDDYGRD